MDTQRIEAKLDRLIEMVNALYIPFHQVLVRDTNGVLSVYPTEVPCQFSAGDPVFMGPDGVAWPCDSGWVEGEWSEGWPCVGYMEGG